MMFLHVSSRMLCRVQGLPCRMQCGCLGSNCRFLWHVPMATWEACWLCCNQQETWLQSEAHLGSDKRMYILRYPTGTSIIAYSSYILERINIKRSQLLTHEIWICSGMAMESWTRLHGEALMGASVLCFWLFETAWSDWKQQNHDM